jgi:hypothetical protein
MVDRGNAEHGGAAGGGGGVGGACQGSQSCWSPSQESALIPVTRARRSVCVDRRAQVRDLRPYLYTTDNFGRTWRDITSNLPDFGNVNTVCEDPRNPDPLYVGTESATPFLPL